MTAEIKIITLAGVNCYLVKAGAGYLLIDSGYSFCRRRLMKVLEREGCRLGNLNLVIITHGDFDHTGNCAYLQKRYGVKIAIHAGEVDVVEKGDMTASREQKQGIIVKAMLSSLGLIFFKKFKPDFYIDEGYDFSEYGFDARVLNLPGHSKGSIGILTADGDLFCGDLLINGGEPAMNTNVDESTAKDSVEKLKRLNIRTVYPGHGHSFPISMLVEK